MTWRHHIRRIKRVLALMLAISFILLQVGCGKQQDQAGQQQAPRKLVVTSYGGAYEEFFRSEVIPSFEKEYNCKVELAVGLAKDWLAKMRAAGPDNPPYDVVMTNEIWASQERAEGFFVPLPSDKVPNLKDVHPLLRNKDDNGVLGIIQPIGIAYRTDRVKNPPTSWKDLWKPEYKGKLGLYTITNSAGMMFVTLVSKVFTGDEHNIDVALEEIKKLKPFKQTDFSGDMEKLLSQGEIDIGILDSPAVARLRHQGLPIGWVAPTEGVYMFEQDFNVTKGSKVKDLAYAWIDYNLRPEVQEKWMRKFYTTPANVKVSVPPELQSDIPIYGDKLQSIITWDWKWINQEKQSLTEKWNKEFTR
ncbi:ABC transporter substrate-binding protein [Neomoorella mulderi]|uniref:Spermidine/putrescine-binding periplasmic protein n=1 Tax=Moorella mulderi DSM 14980 TaxID=1122241 RepID=A0A151AVE5_9FIRM|nr:ABC transporter substrate-binding protein [Moorella mulderi]KYH31626.1 spermidine/putrescine-binding periplasmic protein precursor [Moorella mulderi DSM 14980]